MKKSVAPVTHAEDRVSLIPLVAPLAAGDRRRREHTRVVSDKGAGRVNPSALVTFTFLKLVPSPTEVQHLCASLTPTDHQVPLNRLKLENVNRCLRQPLTRHSF